jgi:putative methionine-R-sulfoxide reductase with GAF domain
MSGLDWYIARDAESRSEDVLPLFSVKCWTWFYFDSDSVGKAAWVVAVLHQLKPIVQEPVLSQSVVFTT